MGMPSAKDGGVAVVTGASSGIGEALARSLASRGYPLVLIARRKQKLEQLAADLSTRFGVLVDVFPTDLADASARHSLCEKLATMNVAILCNNAGQASWGKVTDLDATAERLQVQLNVVAVHELALAVLPGMIARGCGAIEFTGSIAGMQPIPGCATYSAGKAFVNSFAESLHQEVKASGISCTVLAPGPVATEIIAASGIQGVEGFGGSLVWMQADVVAEQTIKAMERGERMVIPGLFAKAHALTGRMAPRRLVVPFMQRIGERVIAAGGH